MEVILEIKILFADDHEVFHDCIKALFDTHATIRVLATVSDGRSAVRLAQELAPDVVVMDLAMPLLNGIEATRQIVSANDQAKVLALSSHKERKFILSVLKAGARGYVVKDSAISELIHAIEAVAAGRMYLSPSITDVVLESLLVEDGGEGAEINPVEKLSTREREILQLLAEGKNAREIAELLNLSPKTVESHRNNIMHKVGADSLPELTKIAIREGLTPL